MRTPQVLPTLDGRRLLAMPEDGQPDPRHVVHFEFLPGVEPDGAGERLPRLVRAARRHHRADARARADLAATAGLHAVRLGLRRRLRRASHGGAAGRTGSRSVPPEREVLGRLDAALRSRLARFGSEPHRYGLVHADLRLANLLEDGDQTYVIDFDDCGFGWFLYDFGTAVSFFEHDPRVPELTDAWVRGYRARAGPAGRGRGRDPDVRPDAPAAAGRLDRLALRHGPGPVDGRRLHRRRAASWPRTTSHASAEAGRARLPASTPSRRRSCSHH